MLDIRQTPALFLRVTHHNSDIVASALNTLGLFTVETLSNLPCEIQKSKTQRASRVFKLQFQFCLARLEAVCDVLDARIFMQNRLQSFYRLQQNIIVLVRELNIYRCTCAHNFRKEFQG